MSVFGEDHQGHEGNWTASQSLSNATSDLPQIRKREANEEIVIQTRTVRFEQLEKLSTGTDLLDEILDDEIGQELKKIVRFFHVSVQPFLRLRLRFTSFA